MTFKINEYTTINNFKRLGNFTQFMKFGQPYDYEEITGDINGEKIKAFICLDDDNIYKLEKI